jgi:hypothetical protein
MDSTLSTALAELVTQSVTAALREALSGDGLPGYPLTFIDVETSQPLAEDRWSMLPVIGGTVRLYPARRDARRFAPRPTLDEQGEDFEVRAILFDPGSTGEDTVYVPDVAVYVVARRALRGGG